MEPLNKYFAAALRRQSFRYKARLTGNGLVHAKSRNAVAGRLARNPIMSYHFCRAGADSPNHGGATTRQTYGYVVAIAPCFSNYPLPAQPRNI